MRVAIAIGLLLAAARVAGGHETATPPEAAVVTPAFEWRPCGRIPRLRRLTPTPGSRTAD